MIEQITVVFDFDTENKTVSNVKVVNASEKKIKTTKKVKDMITDTSSDPIISLEPNKLIFNSKAMSEMNIQPEDRIIIKWDKEKNKMIPIIGKDISFLEEGSGNKVTKSNSIAYKGKANMVLSELGSEFSIIPYKDGIWKLIPTSINTISEDVSLEQITEQAELIEPELIVEGDDETQIDELQFKF